MNNTSSQDSLFPSTHTKPPQPTSDYFHPGDHAPLAARMRPRSLDDVVGQEHLLGEGRHYDGSWKAPAKHPSSSTGHLEPGKPPSPHF